MKFPIPDSFPAKVAEQLNFFLSYQRRGRAKFFTNRGDSSKDEGISDVIFSETEDSHNVVTSLYDGYTSYGNGPSHRPILDIDFPVIAVPSTNPGHYHLYMDRALTWRQYHFLLWALWKSGIIEEGYFRASVKRGYTTARLPWIKKEKPKPNTVVAAPSCDCPLCQTTGRTP